MERKWGDWSQIKLEALSRYLAAFTTASQKAKGTLYLDLFAGADENTLRADGETLLNSPRRALEARPAFTRMVFCELHEGSARNLDRSLHDEHRNRDIVVLPGDCNETMPRYLKSLAAKEPGWRKAPVFAFLDQFSAEIHWETLVTLSRFREGTSKVELWMLIGDSFMPRGAYAAEDGQPVHPKYAERLDRMFGTTIWRELATGRSDGHLSGKEYKAELVNLMRWRLEKDLGYAVTMPLQFVSDNNKPLYNMIFATDHPVGTKIMKSVFASAWRDLEDMKVKYKLAEKGKADQMLGIETLFDITPGLMSRSTAVLPLLGPPQKPWTRLG
jgi:three-Cys-motif partner protein